MPHCDDVDAVGEGPAARIATEPSSGKPASQSWKRANCRPADRPRAGTFHPWGSAPSFRRTQRGVPTPALGLKLSACQRASATSSAGRCREMASRRRRCVERWAMPAAGAARDGGRAVLRRRRDGAAVGPASDVAARTVREAGARRSGPFDPAESATAGAADPGSRRRARGSIRRARRDFRRHAHGRLATTATHRFAQREPI